MMAKVLRILATIIACLITVVCAFYTDKNNQAALYSPFLFIVVIILTNLDQVRVNKLKALGLGLMLALPVFFISALAVVAFTKIVKDAQLGIVLGSALSAGLLFLVNSLYFNIRSFKACLAITAVLGGIAPFVAQFFRLYLPGINSSAGLVEDPALFFICWQVLVGLGISIGIWVKAD
ncbi:hypothetical protein [Pontibacter chinhatensis]|uniref:Uncharacterized protein n=1 Tax=Pontibacter chinhatensis TaxID=1436961 RepID=A0A1I2V946_9BACT|nr:hypothetical protein [Pontibacter chinhatensis]SFG85885.1 hypothetical protein SAMN05421739_10497 [Pontibacter chinhatensis]